MEDYTPHTYFTQYYFYFAKRIILTIPSIAEIYENENEYTIDRDRAAINPDTRAIMMTSVSETAVF